MSDNRAEKKSVLNQILADWLASGSDDTDMLRAWLDEAGLTAHASGLDEALAALSGGSAYVRIEDPRKLIHLPPANPEPENKPSDTPRLFQVFSDVHNWQGSTETVRYNWFYIGRDSNPPVPYSEAIADWTPNEDGKRNYDTFGYTEGFIDELFTLNEALQLVSFLAANRVGTHGISAVELPEASNRIGFDHLPYGGSDDRYALWRAEDYDLPFKVEGWFRFDHVYRTHLEATLNEDGSIKRIDHVREWTDGKTPDDVTPLRGDIDDIPF